MPSFTYFFCVVARLTSTSSVVESSSFVFFPYQTYVDTVRIGEVGPW